MDIKKAREVSRLINRLFKEEQWEQARIFILKLVEEEPDNHWLLVRLSDTYYEEKKYNDAGKILHNIPP